jgi:hypothetical protein
MSHPGVELTDVRGLAATDINRYRAAHKNEGGIKT